MKTTLTVVLSLFLSASADAGYIFSAQSPYSRVAGRYTKDMRHKMSFYLEEFPWPKDGVTWSGSGRGYEEWNLTTGPIHVEDGVRECWDTHSNRLIMAKRYSDGLIFIPQEWQVWTTCGMMTESGGYYGPQPAVFGDPTAEDHFDIDGFYGSWSWTEVPRKAARRAGLVPEPSSATLLLLGLVAVIRKKAA